jgi:NAD(P)-dependent dehydrogenase (short-subunit alcohol dehydrogenase family)
MIVGVLTLFLSGGTGFVGSHVARVFLAHGWRVRALARRPERSGLLVPGVAALQTPWPRTIAVPASAVRHLGLVAALREGFARMASTFNRDKVREILQTDWLCETEPFLRDLQIKPTTRWQDGIRRACRWYVEARWLSSRAFASV